MNNKLTHVAFIIDKSGSMAPYQKDTIGGFNRMIADQRKTGNRVEVTLVTFDTEHRMVFKALDVEHVKDLSEATYAPSGGTALLDAVGITIDKLGKHFAGLSESRRPGKVLFVIITDGEENSSRKFTKAQVQEKVKHQTEKYSWAFTYIGANVDAFHEAQSLGLTRGCSVGYTEGHVGTAQVYQLASNMVRSISSTESMPTSLDIMSYATPSMDQINPAVGTNTNQTDSSTSQQP